MDSPFARAEMLIGRDKIKLLSKSHVAVFGLGGVGSFAVEALARSSIGYIDIFDGDKVEITNINRQLIATSNNIGVSKVEAMKKRILEINPNAKVCAHQVIYNSNNYLNYSFKSYDYIIDAIDTITSKILIIV